MTESSEMFDNSLEDEMSANSMQVIIPANDQHQRNSVNLNQMFQEKADNSILNEIDTSKIDYFLKKNMVNDTEVENKRKKKKFKRGLDNMYSLIQKAQKFRTKEDIDEIFPYLLGVNLFQDLVRETQVDQENIKFFAKYISYRLYKAGDIIYYRGDTDEQLYIVF